jgi:small subunit ribosomal protein S21
MAKVVLKPGESLVEAVRRFKREVMKEGIILEMRRREFYEKPSDLKKRRKSQKQRMIEREIEEQG